MNPSSNGEMILIIFENYWQYLPPARPLRIVG